MRRSEIWLINLDPAIGAEIKKTRPAVIVNEDTLVSYRSGSLSRLQTGKTGMNKPIGW